MFNNLNTLISYDKCIIASLGKFLMTLSANKQYQGTIGSIQKEIGFKNCQAVSTCSSIRVISGSMPTRPG